jgi:hypothetical protein
MIDHRKEAPYRIQYKVNQALVTAVIYAENLQHALVKAMGSAALKDLVGVSRWQN